MLISGVLHRKKEITLHAIVANGGQQPERRAKLARCIMDAIGVRDVPVGVGSAGKPYAALSHEYALPGCEHVDAARLLPGHALLLDVLRASRKRSLTFVCISSLRDLADVIAAEPELFLARTREVTVMGGLTWDDANTKWRPDSCAAPGAPCARSAAAAGPLTASPPNACGCARAAP